MGDEAPPTPETGHRPVSTVVAASRREGLIKLMKTASVATNALHRAHGGVLFACLAVAAAFLSGACGRAGEGTASPPPGASAEVAAATSQSPTTAAASATTSPAPLTATRTPTDTHTPPPSATPAPVLRQITTGGCCVQPAWSPDGSEIWYIDRPSATDPSGLWAVPAEGGAARFVTDRLGIRSADGQLIAYPEAGQTYIERLGGERWAVANGGRAISFSPDGTRIAWQQASSTVNFDRRQVALWVANLDGSEARQVLTLTGGGLVDWLPDGQRWLVSGRDEGDRQDFYAVYDLAQDSLTVVVEAAELRGGLLSPDGGWLAYQVTFTGDADDDGLWIMPLAGGEARRLEYYGAYRWRDNDELLVIPLDGAATQRLVSVRAESGEARALTDPSVTPVRIAGGDWALAPDGRRIVFVSAEDHNVWIAELTD